MTNPEFSPARDIARQVLSHAVAGARHPRDISAALQLACTRTSENLRRAVGDDGYDALLSRALRRAEPKHPALAAIRHNYDRRISLDGVAASVDTYGLPAVTAALEALFEALADILSGLIGADMVLSLLDYDGPLLKRSHNDGL